MANCYTDVTGVLVFDGTPIITPIVELFFKPFGLAELDDSQTALDPNAMFINQSDEVDIATWDGLRAAIEEACMKFVYGPSSRSVPDDVSIQDLILALGRHFGADETALRETTEGIDFENEVLDLPDVFDVVMALKDGHNLKAIRLMAGYHADRVRLYAFGGYFQHCDRQVSLGFSTYRMIEASRKIERGEPEEAFGDIAQILLDSVQDKELKGRVAARIGQIAARVIAAT